MAKNYKEIEAELAQVQQEKEQLQAELAALRAAPPVQRTYTPDPELSSLMGELRQMKKDLLVTKGELQVALDTARTNAGLNIPKTQPINPKDIIRVPQPKGSDGVEQPPPAGAVLKKFRVTLQHCATKIIEMWEMPGQGFASHGVAIAAFNRYMGVRSTEYAHEVTEVTGPEVLVAAQPMAKQMDMYSPEVRAAVETGAVRDPSMAKIESMMAEVG